MEEGIIISVCRFRKQKKERLRSPEDVLKVIAKELATYDREVFAVWKLKTNGQPINLSVDDVLYNAHKQRHTV